ncbi:unnamed protein product [Durusdinium trenchii]|uniref:Uncharacterized protein n=1 Tax=Durusdinium trenchii TaxID=1381693 RepID=A0ABP0N9D1_9DINO
MAARLPSFPGGLDLVAQLNLTGPRDFLLQLEEELEIFVRSQRKELLLPPLRAAPGLVEAFPLDRHTRRVARLGTALLAHHPWRGAAPLAEAQFGRVSARATPHRSARCSRLCQAGSLSEEEILQRLRLRLWAALLCCASAERAVQAPVMAPAVEPLTREADSDDEKRKVQIKDEQMKVEQEELERSVQRAVKAHLVQEQPEQLLSPKEEQMLPAEEKLLEESVKAEEHGLSKLEAGSMEEPSCYCGADPDGFARGAGLRS